MRRHANHSPSAGQRRPTRGGRPGAGATGGGKSTLQAITEAPCGELFQACSCLLCVLLVWSCAFFAPELGTAWFEYLDGDGGASAFRDVSLTSIKRHNSTAKACAQRCFREGKGSIFFLPLDRWRSAAVNKRNAGSRLQPILRAALCQAQRMPLPPAARAAQREYPQAFAVMSALDQTIDSLADSAMATGTNQRNGGSGSSGNKRRARPTMVFELPRGRPVDSRVFGHRGVVFVAEIRHPLASASAETVAARTVGSHPTGSMVLQPNRPEGALGATAPDPFASASYVEDPGRRARRLRSLPSQPHTAPARRRHQPQAEASTAEGRRDRSLTARRGSVPSTINQFYVRLLTAKPNVINEISQLSFRRAKRVLGTFDMVLVGEWEHDPNQRRALLALLSQTPDAVPFLTDQEVAGALGLPWPIDPALQATVLGEPPLTKLERTSTKQVRADSEMDLRLFHSAVNQSNAATQPHLQAPPPAAACPNYTGKTTCDPRLGHVAPRYFGVPNGCDDDVALVRGGSPDRHRHRTERQNKARSAQAKTKRKSGSRG